MFCVCVVDGMICLQSPVKSGEESKKSCSSVGAGK